MMQSKQSIARAFAPLMILFLVLEAGSAALLAVLGVSLSAAMVDYMLGGLGIAAVALLTGWLLCGPRGFTALAIVAAVTLMSPGALLFSYACIAASASFPLVDAQLAAIDAALGFDWTANVALVGMSSWLAATLGQFYHKAIFALIYVLVFLWVAQRQDRLLEFFWLFILTSLAANMIAVILPAAGAFVHHAPTTDLRGVLPANSGVWHLSHFTMLRDGSFKALDPKTAQGLITFPSFHTAAALLIPIALRGFGPITAIASIVGGVIVVSTIAIGGHYLIDVIAGVAMTFALLPLARRIVSASMRGAEPTPAPAAALQPAAS